MSYPNAYLRDFVPVLGQILKEKQIAPEKLHLEIIDEESEEKSIFEPVGVDEVLDQLADELNHLTVYTDRPAHFQAFAEQIYEENGLFFITNSYTLRTMLCYPLIFVNNSRICSTVSHSLFVPESYSNPGSTRLPPG